MSMSTIESDLLRGMATEDRDRVLSLGVIRKMAEGEVVFALGEETNGVYLLQSGRVNLTLPIRIEGRQQDVLVEERKEGQLLGWSGLVPPYRFTLQARTSVKTELLFFPRTDLEALFDDNPKIEAQLYANLARIIGQRLQVFQTMWLRGVQRGVADGGR